MKKEVVVAWRLWRKLRNISVKTAGLQAEIWTRDFPEYDTGGLLSRLQASVVSRNVSELLSKHSVTVTEERHEGTQ
jgi:hypothetical protein